MGSSLDPKREYAPAKRPLAVSRLGALSAALLRHWPAVLALAYLCVYLTLGSALLQRGLFFCQNVLFDADVERVTADMTDFGAKHSRSSVHPIFPLLVLPLGGLAAKFFQPELVGMVAVALCGGGAVWFAGELLRRVVSEREAVALSALYASSASSLVMFSIVDTFAFSALAIVGLLYCVRRERRAKWPFAVFCAGVLTTNFVHVALAELTTQRGALRLRLRRALVLVLGTLATVTALAWLQKQIWRSARYFFDLSVLRSERRYLFDGLTDASQVLERLAELLSGFFLHSVVAPEPYYWRRADRNLDWASFAGTTFSGYSTYATLLALAVAALWLSAIVVTLRRATRATEIWAVLAALGFHLALMFLYGKEPLLYSPLWMFHLVLWLALALRQTLLPRRHAWWVLAALSGLVFVNNAQVTAAVIQRYDGAIPCASTDKACATAFYRAPEAAQKRSDGASQQKSRSKRELKAAAKKKKKERTNSQRAGEKRER